MEFKFFKSAFTMLAITAVISGAAFGANAAETKAPASESVIISAGRTVNGSSVVASPVISSVKNVVGGVQVNWDEVSGADAYCVYRKTSGSDWKKVGTAVNTSYIDKNIKSGKKYTYTVRCLDAYGNLISSYNSGKSIKYKKSIITKIKNTGKGTKITWTKVKGASKYIVYHLDSKNNWKKLATVKSTSYTHNNLKSGKTYTYKVRCVDRNGNFVGSNDKTGISNTFVVSPKISSIVNIDGGVKLEWKKKKGAASYRVYKKTGKSEWVEIGSSDGTSYVDKDVKSGKKYTYTVRCLGADGNSVSAYNSGKSIKYIKAPTITELKNTSSGIKIVWTKRSSASKYRVYCLNSRNKWEKIATVTSTSYTHKKLENGKVYSYKVKALDSSGKYISAAKAGKSNLFVAPQKITGVSVIGNGNLVKWNAVPGVSGYTLYRKSFRGSFERIADITSGTSYIDTSAKANNLYSYTLSCFDKNGNYISSYIENTEFYINGKIANGDVKIGDKTYSFNKGFFRSGLQKIDGKKYYYDLNGELQKNGIVGSASDGWYYADKNGVIDSGYVDGIKFNGKSWIVINGKASKVSTESDKTLFRAAKEVAKITDTNMTKAEKLKICFNYSKKNYAERRPRTPHYTKMDWPILYANDMFIDGAGNCFSYAAAFAYMAKAIGYEDVYCCNSGGHGWAEVDGLIYDPEWSRHNNAYTYFGLDYDFVKNPNYKDAIANREPWMHVEIKIG